MVSSSLRVKIPLDEIHLEGPLLFPEYKQVNKRYEMNEIVNKFLIAGNKLFPVIHLGQPRFSYKYCRQFTEGKTKNTKIEEI